jgi:hypothetical protein
MAFDIKVFILENKIKDTEIKVQCMTIRVKFWSDKEQEYRALPDSNFSRHMIRLSKNKRKQAQSDLVFYQSNLVSLLTGRAA